VCVCVSTFPIHVADIVWYVNSVHAFALLLDVFLLPRSVTQLFSLYVFISTLVCLCGFLHPNPFVFLYCDFEFVIEKVRIAIPSVSMYVFQLFGILVIWRPGEVDILNWRPGAVCRSRGQGGQPVTCPNFSISVKKLA
jgi:hypothetical protein